MKILVIHNEYQQYGGERVAVESQVGLLKENGHELHLFSRDNAEIAGYGLGGKALFFPRSIFSFQAYREIQDLVRRVKPDVAHVHNVFPLISPSVYLGLDRCGVPIVQSIHNFRFLCPNGLFYVREQICELCKYGNTISAIRYKCYRESYTLSMLYALTIGLHRRIGTFQRVKRFITLNQFAAQKLIEGGLATQDKIDVLGNFIPDPLPDPGLKTTRQPYILFIGRLSSEKGVADLIQAMSGVSRLKLKIMGSGPQMRVLQEKAQNAGGDRIDFLGHVSGDQKWKLLRQAMATVIPSKWYEHLPFALLESWVTQTPVIVPDQGSFPFLVEDKVNGLIYRSIKDLQDQLNWLAENPGRGTQMGQNGRWMVENKYSAAVHYNQLMNIYARVS